MAYQRIRVPGFAGGTDRLISDQASRSRTINWFPETAKGSVKNERYLRPSEGLEPKINTTSVDTTSLFYQDGRAFAVSGVVFGEFFANGTFIEHGTVEYDGTKATMASNGSAGGQVCVCSGGKVYIFSLIDDSFVEVDFGVIEVAMVEFMDGYFFALRRNSRQVYYSELEDGLIWDFTFGLFERSWGSDNVAFIKRAGRQLWVVGYLTTEIWADVGDANVPFAPIQGAFIDKGCIAPFTGQRDGETISWLSQDERGGGEVVRATGYHPESISSYSIATMVQAPTNVLANAEAFVHQIQGHVFYWLYVEGLSTTPVFDFIEKTWSERAIWDKVNGVYLPHVARAHIYAFEKHWVGTRSTGVIYEMSPVYKTDRLVEAA